MENQTETEVNYLTLKFGTLKTWDFNGEKQKALFTEYCEIGSCISAMGQKDTPRQKEIICELIDLCDEEDIFLEFDEKYLSKKKAKEYVMNYNANL